jgi:hypothetical protein
MSSDPYRQSSKRFDDPSRGPRWGATFFARLAVRLARRPLRLRYAEARAWRKYHREFARYCVDLAAWKATYACELECCRAVRPEEPWPPSLAGPGSRATDFLIAALRSGPFLGE